MIFLANAQTKRSNALYCNRQIYKAIIILQNLRLIIHLRHRCNILDRYNRKIQQPFQGDKFEFKRYMHLLNACLVLRQALFMQLFCAPFKHIQHDKLDKMLPNTSQNFTSMHNSQKLIFSSCFMKISRLFVDKECVRNPNLINVFCSNNQLFQSWTIERKTFVPPKLTEVHIQREILQIYQIIRYSKNNKMYRLKNQIKTYIFIVLKYHSSTLIHNQAVLFWIKILIIIESNKKSYF